MRKSDDPSRPRQVVEERVISDLAALPGVIASSLISPEGFCLERSSTEHDLTSVMTLFDLKADSKLVTVVGKEATLVASRMNSGHLIIIKCEPSSNLGRIRIAINEASVRLSSIL